MVTKIILRPITIWIYVSLISPPLRQRLSAVFLFSKSLETIKELLPVYFNNCTGKFIPYRFVRINSASNRLLVPCNNNIFA